jgi:hypothetical protein
MAALQVDGQGGQGALQTSFVEMDDTGRGKIEICRVGA